MEPYFSRQGIAKLQPMLAEVVDKLLSRLGALRESNAVIRLDHVFTAFTGDVIGKICCDEREDFLNDPEFAPQWYGVQLTGKTSEKADFGVGLSFFTRSSNRYLSSWVFHS